MDYSAIENKLRQLISAASTANSASIRIHMERLRDEVGNMRVICYPTNNNPEEDLCHFSNKTIFEALKEVDDKYRLNTHTVVREMSVGSNSFRTYRPVEGTLEKWLWYGREPNLVDFPLEKYHDPNWSRYPRGLEILAETKNDGTVLFVCRTTKHTMYGVATSHSGKGKTILEAMQASTASILKHNKNLK